MVRAAEQPRVPSARIGGRNTSIAVAADLCQIGDVEAGRPWLSGGQEAVDSAGELQGEQPAVVQFAARPASFEGAGGAVGEAAPLLGGGFAHQGERAGFGPRSLKVTKCTKSVLNCAGEMERGAPLS
jgi:hypothetical protein